MRGVAVACALTLIAACFEASTGGGGSSGGGGGAGSDRCGDCVRSEYCPAGMYCDTDPCLIDCSCSSWDCAGTCAGRCTPYSGPHCGDRLCNGAETCGSCPQDCSCVCGDQTCEGNEDCDSCASDCACEACINATDMPADWRATVSVLYIRDTMDGSCATGDGAEKVVRFTAGSIGGTFEARVESADFLVALSVRTTCEYAATEVACAKQLSSTDLAPVRFTLGAQQTAYIIVEAPALATTMPYGATITVSQVQ